MRMLDNKSRFKYECFKIIFMKIGPVEMAERLDKCFMNLY